MRTDRSRASTLVDDGYWREAREQDRAYAEGYRDGRRDARWEIGRALPRETCYVVIRDYERCHLRPPPRGHYAATQLVLEALARR